VVERLNDGRPMHAGHNTYCLSVDYHPEHLKYDQSVWLNVQKFKDRPAITQCV